jgi:membrane-associated protease RseP (regulator of RpoE activity)
MDQAAEVELIRSTVAKFFVVYDVRVSNDAVVLYITPDKATLEAKFDDLRKEFTSKSYIPLLEFQKGEYTISVVRKPVLGKRRLWINIVLLAATAVTTIIAGTYLWAGYVASNEVFTSDNILWGALFFAVPLMTILGVHEMSHFLMSRKYRVEASLPYFIPAIPPLGTFGAFISMRDPMPSKKALVDIGAAGPLGGFLVTIPVAILGLWLNTTGVPHPMVPPGGQTAVNASLFYQLMTLFVPQVPDTYMHPMAFAAWAGFFVTAINLIPAGQLDGGHIARGLFGPYAKYISFAAFLILFGLGLLFYTGWLFFGLLVFILGLNHPAPLNDVSKLGAKHLAVGAAAIVLLIGTFTIVPLYTIPVTTTFDLQVQGENQTTVNPGQVALFAFVINNTGTVNITVGMSVNQVPFGWSAILYPSGSSPDGGTNSLSQEITYNQNATVEMRVQVPDTASPGKFTLFLNSVTSDTKDVKTFNITVS